ncbi:pyridoxal phosphate-dependent aminotransferase [Trinickia fusca]|uniref:Histidinol-phosphate aminotransferase family protein n=1 Tax=Trinickia fusca TaxID=2419777 RepID=A0A494XSI8_9BURK|nr:histidinol-phosphate transaminase [Trinickia fusca]RKP51084.1 histidinol-phosphate aminotransferase family protein [Trinickia fusca]
MAPHPLARRAIVELPLPGPLTQAPSKRYALDDNLPADDGPWRAYPHTRPLDLIEGVIELWRDIEERKGIRLELGFENVLLTHGGVDALNLALTVFCEPGRDAVGIPMPCFEAFPHWATLHGLRVATLEHGDWRTAATSDTKALLLCSPHNPLGTMMMRDEIRALLTTYRGVVIVDEAYADFSDKASAISLVDEFANLVVLRTLSKSFGLAGLRVGALVGHASTIDAALRVQIPFAMPIPVIDALRVSLGHAQAIHDRLAFVRVERVRVAALLAMSPHVTSVLPTDANFLCVRWRSPDLVHRLLENANVGVRHFAAVSRVTVGDRDANDVLLKALGVFITETN